MPRAKPYCKDNDEPQDIPHGFYIRLMGQNTNTSANLNQFTYLIPTLPLDPDVWFDFLVAWWGLVSTDVLAAMSGLRTITAIEMRNAKKGANKVLYTLDDPVEGVISGTALPDQSSVAITYTTFEPSEGGPGGMRWGPIPTASQSGRNLILPDLRALILQMLENAHNLEPSGHAAELVKFDRCHGTTAKIVAFNCSRTIKQQDSREEGRGV